MDNRGESPYKNLINSVSVTNGGESLSDSTNKRHPTPHIPGMESIPDEIFGYHNLDKNGLPVPLMISPSPLSDDDKYKILFSRKYTRHQLFTELLQTIDINEIQQKHNSPNSAELLSTIDKNKSPLHKLPSSNCNNSNCDCHNCCNGMKRYGYNESYIYSVNLI